MSCNLRPVPLVLGSKVDPGDAFGRAALRDRIVHALEGTSYGVRITGDRRYGKTTLCRLVRDSLEFHDVDVLYVSAELDDPADLVDAIADGLSAGSGALGREIGKWRLSEVDAGYVKAERSAPRRSIESLLNRALAADTGRRMVLIIDEITVLAMKMERSEPGSGDNLLHSLRRLRERHEGRLAMVLLGSVGFHHIAKDSLGTTNDLEGISVGAIADDDATCMARCLLLGANVASSDEKALGIAIAGAAEGVPYYVQVLVKLARDRQTIINQGDVAGLVIDAIEDIDDPMHLKHYVDRIPTYYGDVRGLIVAAILDLYAADGGWQDTADIARGLSTSMLATRPEGSELTELLQLLEADHYLSRSGSRRRFSSDLVRRGWLYHRG